MPEILTTLGACVDAEPALSRLAAHTWPVKTAYHIARLLKLVREESRAFEDERVKLVRALGVARPPTETEQARGLRDEVIEVPADKLKDYLQQHADLRAVPATIGWAPLTVDMIEAQTQPIPATDLDIGPFLLEPSGNGGPP